MNRAGLLDDPRTVNALSIQVSKVACISPTKKILEDGFVSGMLEIENIGYIFVSDIRDYCRRYLGNRSVMFEQNQCFVDVEAVL